MASNTAPSPTTSPKIHFKEPFGARRLSLSGDSEVIDDDQEHYQDWSKTTDEKDSWANRERRRSSVWQKIDSYPTVKKSPSNSMSNENERRGSILSMWTHGKDKNGRDVLHSGEPDENEVVVETIKPTMSITGEPEIEVRSDRRGSILSLWTQGMDKSGRHVIHSGFEDDE